jgi:DNA transformation protein
MPSSAFARHCCELLASAGPCEIRPMFGAWGISTGGYNIAIVADRGSGERLWLKADGAIRSYYEVAGCERFTYMAKGVQRSVNYYSAPSDAMESAELMAPWARQALECALKAHSAKEERSSRPSELQPRPTRAASSRPAALAPSRTAKRRSSTG